MHLLFLCNNARHIWKNFGWWNLVHGHLHSQHNFLATIFPVLQTLNDDQAVLFFGEYSSKEITGCRRTFPNRQILYVRALLIFWKQSV
jgi:hypothetical protein